MEKLKRVQIADGVYFNTIKDERFKTGRIAVVMGVELNGDSVSANAVVPNILTRSCREYPTFLELSRKLDMLYGASLTSSSMKIGEEQVIVISASGLDDRYSPDGEPVYSQLAEVLCKAVFEPNVRDGAFDEESFKQEQRQLLDAIDAQYNDKRAYSMKRMLEVMCEGEKFSVSRYGTKEQVQSLTAKSAYDAYLNIITSARVEIVCLCSSPADAVQEIFAQKFSSVDRKPERCATQVIRSADKVKEHTDVIDVAQSKLILGFRTDCAEPEQSVIAEKLMCAVLGGTAHSKLFNNVREKLSLCYYCVSRLDVSKGIMFIESGVQKENIDKAREAILAEVEEMKKGNISDEEINSAKLSVCSSYLTSVDSSAGTQGWYIGQLLKDRCRTPQEEAELISEVTKEELVAAANKLTLDTVYVLTGSESEETE